MHGPDQVPLKVVKREITFSSSVSHDNIVRLLDVFAEKQQLVIVWELISGPDLLDLLNECGGRMPEDMAAFYFTQALRGLVFMHANGFCHRDIKPENCMVQRANHQLKLIDFGLSKHLASAKTIGVGTPDYMSPEMLVQQQQMGYEIGTSVQTHPYDARRVDAWAMGVLMYLLVTGRYPFEDDQHPNNLAATVTNVLAGRLRPLPPGVTASCTEMIAGLLQPRPERRSTLLDLVDNPWLAAAAMQYAHRVSEAEGRPGALDQWIDLREYRHLAAMNERSRQKHTQPPPPLAAVAAPASQRQNMTARNGIIGVTAKGGDGRSPFASASASAAFGSLIPASSSAGSEELAAVASAMQAVAGVRPISDSDEQRAGHHHRHHHHHHHHHHACAVSLPPCSTRSQHRHQHQQQHQHQPHKHRQHDRSSDGESSESSSVTRNDDSSSHLPQGGVSEQAQPPQLKGALAKVRAYFRRKLDC
ncbi:hypothetical protein Vafri_9634 [Volvox africanus]|uniref:Protein kinase domain-containing protein n=1 Tax=Volvox africanus TaxID=51714 RepID=A0A8J4B5K1_9CHLO|nr:hypothetical protein Vafri_9634 [Volvox africanus]